MNALHHVSEHMYHLASNAISSDHPVTVKVWFCFSSEPTHSDSKKVWIFSSPESFCSLMFWLPDLCKLFFLVKSVFFHSPSLFFLLWNSVHGHNRLEYLENIYCQRQWPKAGDLKERRQLRRDDPIKNKIQGYLGVPSSCFYNFPWKCFCMIGFRIYVQLLIRTHFTGSVIFVIVPPLPTLWL